MVAPEDDPLAVLFADADVLDLKRIATALATYVSIDSKTGRLHPKAEFAPLSNRVKILIALLVRKVGVLRDVVSGEGMTSEDVSSETGVSLASVRSRVSDLVADRLIARDEGELSVPPVQLARVLEEIEGASVGRRTSTSAPAKSRKKAQVKTEAQASGAAPKDAASAEHANKRGKKGASGPGPAQMVRDLIGQGWFEQRRTLGDVQEYLRHKRGYQVKVTTLSPVFTRLLRSGELDRERNDEATYEYFVPGKG